MKPCRRQPDPHHAGLLQYTPALMEAGHHLGRTQYARWAHPDHVQDVGGKQPMLAELDGLPTHTLAVRSIGSSIPIGRLTVLRRPGTRRRLRAVLRRVRRRLARRHVARWSANPLGMLWPQMDAAGPMSGGGGDPSAVAQRPLVVVAVG
jgi:hypothetical protein